MAESWVQRRNNSYQVREDARAAGADVDGLDGKRVLLVALDTILTTGFSRSNPGQRIRVAIEEGEVVTAVEWTNAGQRGIEVTVASERSRLVMPISAGLFRVV